MLVLILQFPFNEMKTLTGVRPWVSYLSPLEDVLGKLPVSTGLVTCLHLRMYWVMWAEEGAFHWMGWESGWFPLSVIITWTGRCPPADETDHK